MQIWFKLCRQDYIPHEALNISKSANMVDF